MKRKRMRVGSLWAALLLTVTGCGSHPAEEYVPTGATLEVSFDHAYRSEAVPMGSVYGHMEFSNVGQYILQTGYQEQALYKPEDKRQYDIFAYAKTATDTHFVNIIGATEADGNITLLYRCQDVVDPDSFTLTPPTYYEEVYDAGLSCVSEKDVTAKFASIDLQGWYSHPNGQQYGIVSEDGSIKLYRFDEQGEPVGQVTGGFSNPAEVIFDQAGNAYVISYMGNARILRIDPETLTAEAVEPEGMPEWTTSIFPGNADYLFFCEDADGIYGVKAGTEEVEQIISWTNSDFDSRNVLDVAMQPNGKFLVAEQYSYDGMVNYYELTERTEEEKAAMELVTLATQNAYYLTPLVQNYNRQSEDVRVLLYDYEKEYPELSWAEQIEQFEKDLLDGKVPDMIETRCLPYEKLENKNMFEDLSVWMDEDASFHEEDYMMNLMECLDPSDTLYSVGFFYSVDVMLGKTAWVGERETLRLEDLQTLFAEKPEDMAMFMKFASSTENWNWVWSHLLGDLYGFIDWDKGTCDFDNAEFAGLLEFVKQCEEESKMQPPTSDYAYAQDKVLLSGWQIHHPYQLHQMIAGDFGGADVQLLGTAAGEMEGNGGTVYTQRLSISRNSLYKDACWEFIKYCLSPEAQRAVLEQPTYQGLSMHREVLAEQLTEATQDPVPGKYGTSSFDDRMAYVGSDQIPIGNATQEEMDALLAYIEGIGSFGDGENEIDAIVKEEAAMFRAGDCTAEQAAEKIQNRVELYLSERA